VNVVDNFVSCLKIKLKTKSMITAFILIVKILVIVKVIFTTISLRKMLLHIKYAVCIS
jgi:hypothetical protein